MKLQQICETFDNLFTNDTDERRRFADQVFNLITNAYKSIGGIKGKGFDSPQDMIDNIRMWKLFRRGDQVKAVMMYKDTNGRKRVAMATDGSLDGKRMLANMIIAEYKDEGRSYAEISGPSLSFHLKVLGDQAFDQITIPAKRAMSILNKTSDEIRILNDFEYQRNINDEWITKRMVGTPGNQMTN